MTGRVLPRRSALAAGGAFLLALGGSGCGSDRAGARSGTSGTSGSTTSAASSADAVDKLFQESAERTAAGLRANGAIDAYAGALLVLGDRVAWGGFDDDRAKQGALAGRGVLSLPDIPTSVPKPRTVTFGDGTSRALSLISATAAAAEALPYQCGPAERCAVSLDRVRLTTAERETNHGRARVPVWEFTGGGLADPLLVLAIDPEQAGDWVALEPATPVDRSIAGPEYLIETDGSSITFGLGTSPCDTGIRPQVFEAADVIVLGARLRPGGACNAMLLVTPVTVRLAAPVGARPVVGVRDGRLVLPQAVPRG